MRLCASCLCSVGFGKRVITRQTGIPETSVRRIKKASITPLLRRPTGNFFIQFRPAKQPTRATQLTLSIHIDEETRKLCARYKSRRLRTRRIISYRRREKARQKALYESLNAEALKKYFKERNLKNKEALKNYRKMNAHRYREYTKQWRINNPEKARENRKRYGSSPYSKLVRNLRRRVRDSLKSNIRSGSASSLTGCSRGDLLKHIESKFVSWMTWENYGTRWHIDHIKPCASFDLSQPDQQRACFHWSNLQPLEASENMSKGASLEWTPKLPPYRDSFFPNAAGRGREASILAHED